MANFHVILSFASLHYWTGRALVIVGSMGSFEPMDFWELFKISFTEEIIPDSELLSCLDVQEI